MEPGITESGMWHKTLSSDLFSPHPYGNGLLFKKCYSLGQIIKASDCSVCGREGFTEDSCFPWASPCTPCRAPEHCYFTLFSRKSSKRLPDKDKFSIPLKRKTSWDIRLTAIRDWLPDFWRAGYIISISAQFSSTNMFLSGCWIKTNKPANKSNNKVTACRQAPHL